MLARKTLDDISQKIIPTNVGQNIVSTDVGQNINDISQKNLTNVDQKNPNQHWKKKTSHGQYWLKTPSRCWPKNITDRHWLKTLANLNHKIILPKIDQKHPWPTSTENELTDVSRKRVLVDVILKMSEPMSAQIALVEVGWKYPNQDRLKIVLTKVGWK